MTAGYSVDLTKRASANLASSARLYWAVPDGFTWLTIPFVPVMMFGIPIGTLLLTHQTLRSKPWLPALVASVAFTAAWSVWVARDYYFRLAH